ncbi:MAG: CoA pyrophosphatase [Deltaproteobacteria bacterium]|nr:CoA pyrophosphatase [Deltaproteobacteria bacterium]
MIGRNEIKRILAGREKEIILFSDKPARPSAVLIPLYEKDGEYRVLLTKRTEELEYHKGQICFPGGSPHDGDSSLEATALREAREEVGIRPEDVEVLGELDSTGTLTSNFLITPFVGIIPYPYPFKVNRHEIDELVEVPLSALAGEGNYWEETRSFEGVTGKASFFRYRDKVIWGATARILKQLVDLVNNKA